MLVGNRVDKKNMPYTVRLLEAWHLEENCPITMISENRRFPSFFANEPITFMNLRALT